MGRCDSCLGVTANHDTTGRHNGCEVVQVEAQPGPITDREITCLSCGGPLNGRQDPFLLKYFLVERAKRRAKCFCDQSGHAEAPVLISIRIWLMRSEREKRKLRNWLRGFPSRGVPRCAITASTASNPALRKSATG